MPGTGRNILVTGGGGYIGSHCILQLLQEDFNVIAVDNFVNSIKGMVKICIFFYRELHSYGSRNMKVVILRSENLESHFSWLQKTNKFYSVCFWHP